MHYKMGFIFHDFSALNDYTNIFRPDQSVTTFEDQPFFLKQKSLHKFLNFNFSTCNSLCNFLLSMTFFTSRILILKSSRQQRHFDI